MTIKNLIAIVAYCAAAATLAGCASVSGASFRRSEARTVQNIQFGEVVEMRLVEIEGEPTALGRIGGAYIGHALGMEKGGLLSRQAATGAVLGSTAGEIVERRLRTRPAIEITVKLDNGRLLVVVQDTDVLFSRGERVRLLTSGDGTSRVSTL